MRLLMPTMEALRKNQIESHNLRTGFHPGIDRVISKIRDAKSKIRSHFSP
jgi:hypothetical protein